MKSEKLREKILDSLFPECVCGECSKYKPKCNEATISHVDLPYFEFLKLIDDFEVACFEEGNNFKGTQ